MFSKLLLLTVLAVIPMIAHADECASGFLKNALTIGTFPGKNADTTPTTATADYYYSCNPEVASNAPLVIIVPGADAGKDKYSMAAKAFVDRGYTAAVLEEPSISVVFGQTVTLYLATSRTLKAFIDRVTDDVDFPADTDQIYLAGHSFGGSSVLYYMAGECPPEFCAEGARSLGAPSDKIKAVGTFAYTLTRFDFITDVISFEEVLKNVGFPFFVVYVQNVPRLAYLFLS
jgi:predicted alpha/beta-fold hydrolase